VGVSFGFGLASDHFTFVSWNRFWDRQPWRHRIPRERADVVYKRSTVINNYIVGNNNTVINEGIGREKVALAARSEVKKVSLRDVNPRPNSTFKGEQLDRDGAALAVYRPKFPDLRATKVRSVETPGTAQPGKVNGTPQRALASAPPTRPETSVVFPAKPRRKTERLADTPTPSVPRPTQPSTIARPLERPQAPVAETRVARPSVQTDAGRSEVKATQKPGKGRSENLARNEFVPKPGVGDVNLSQPKLNAKPAEPIAPRERSGKLDAPKVNTTPKTGVAPQPQAPRPTVASPSIPDSPPVARAPSVPRQEQPKYSRPGPQIDRPGVSSPSAGLPSQPAPSYARPSAPSSAYQTPSRAAPSYSPPPVATRPPPSYSPPQVSRPAPSYSPPASRPAPSYSPPPSRPAPSSPPSSSGGNGSGSRRTQPN
jgi:hypothetical protein